METERPARSGDTSSFLASRTPDPVTAQLTRRPVRIGRRTHLVGAGAAVLVVVLGLAAAAVLGSSSSGGGGPLLAGTRPGPAPTSTPTVAPTDTPHPTTSTFDSAAPEPQPVSTAPDYSTVVDDVLPGDCIRDSIEHDTTVAEVYVVNCAEPHAVEVYATFDLPGSTFPGAASAHRQAQNGCDSRFAAFDGRSASSSGLEVSYLVPTTGSWSHADHTVRCLVAEPNEAKRSGSLRNSGR